MALQKGRVNRPIVLTVNVQSGASAIRAGSTATRSNSLIPNYCEALLPRKWRTRNLPGAGGSKYPGSGD